MDKVIYSILIIYKLQCSNVVPNLNSVCRLIIIPFLFNISLINVDTVHIFLE